MRTLAVLFLAIGLTAGAAERLDRGAVAVCKDRGVYLSWRSHGSDPEGLTFDVYRDGKKVNPAPHNGGTNFTDSLGTEQSVYTLKSSEGEAVKGIRPWSRPELRIHLDRPEGGVSPDGREYTYTPGDCSVGDVDGDGRYEIIVKWDPSNAHDNSHPGYTGNVLLDCYTLEGKKLWRIDLGRNIRAGQHYTQFLVYDFDGDGRAEMVCKTAPGTIDGRGKAVLIGDAKVSDDYRSAGEGKKIGQILSGPEYLTVFEGKTGRELATVPYEPGRDVLTTKEWGDDYGNRANRFLATVAYLDGRHPSIVMCRGYYTASFLCAWDFDGKTLKRRWLHASTTRGEGAYGEGAHSTVVGDVDGDGRDEIVYGSACIDDDGSLLYRTGFGHGDALHLGDFDPANPGLEVFMTHENKEKAWDMELRDAATGRVLWGEPNSTYDVGRGIIADVTDRHAGHELWGFTFNPDGSRNVYNADCHGNKIGKRRFPTNFRIYWDGDLLDELFDGAWNDRTRRYEPAVTKPRANLSGTAARWEFPGTAACNSTKSTPNIQADILGDWREEIILYDPETCSDLLLFTTTIPTDHRVPCLMEDHNYRISVAAQNSAYNQPPHLSYRLHP